ncbi:hypothetical protein IV203_015326 [Nitzschia inconspicua]|uniref:Uncharacterized protein n=1 Tax=Nitzschia inconspicua TaxID=303405 RepID=A0A9K3PT60_9STRA|nr:hypothetical protein IV203_015326 [Nitzschia inconspicua]
MPATAGRVRMPHNNRMTTSATLKTSDIWSKTIGHDPYANQTEQHVPDKDAAGVSEAKVKNVMEMARTQNVTDGSNREGFTAKLYLGLKKGKVRRSGTADAMGSGAVDPKMQQLLEDPDSSSEEEFLEITEESRRNERNDKEEKRKRKKKSKKSKKRKERSRHSSSSDEDDSSSSSSDESDDSEDRRRQRRREKRRREKKRKHSKRSSRDEDRDSDSESEEKKRRKHKRHKKESKKNSRNHKDDQSDSD